MTQAATGREFKLSISFDSGITFETIGPVNTKDLNAALPTADVTTQSDTTDYSDFCHTKYKNITINIGGFVKNVEGVDPETGNDFYTYKELSGLANGPLSSAKAYVRLADSNDLYEGEFLFGDFARTGGQSDMSEFTSTLQSKGSGVEHLDGTFNAFMIFMEKTLPDEWQPFL